MRGATLSDVACCLTCCHFNPRSPCGERPPWRQTHRANNKFQSTLPVRGATIWLAFHSATAAYFNPRSPCGERRQSRTRCGNCRTNFNPRSPCGERRVEVVPVKFFEIFQSTLPVRGATETAGDNIIPRVEFQSTLPVRGATNNREYPYDYGYYFNPRSPCGERL